MTFEVGDRVTFKASDRVRVIVHKTNLTEYNGLNCKVIEVYEYPNHPPSLYLVQFESDYLITAFEDELTLSIEGEKSMDFRQVSNHLNYAVNGIDDKIVVLESLKNDAYDKLNELKEAISVLKSIQSNLKDSSSEIIDNLCGIEGLLGDDVSTPLT